MNITKQPTDTEVFKSQTTTITVEADYDGDATYKWYKTDTRFSANGTEIVGATSSTLTITNAQDSDDAYYYCEITSTVGHKAKTEKTDAVKLTVSEAYFSITANNETTLYKTLKDAFDDAPNNSTIVQNKDCEDSSEATLSGKTLIFNNNGKTLTKTTAGITVNKGATLEIVGAGTITSGENISLIWNYGTLTISHTGTITIGSASSSFNTNNPVIQGATYGIDKTAGGTWNFYNGIIKGKTGAYTGGDPANVRDGYVVSSTGTETIKGQTYYTAVLKQNQTITIPATVSVNYGETTTVNVTFSGDRALTATPADSTIATTTKVVTITGASQACGITTPANASIATNPAELVVNGDGSYGDNTNFSSWTYDPNNSTNYNGKIATKEEVEKNKEKSEQLINLAHELRMRDDMAEHELGYEENGSPSREGMSEEEKKAQSQMATEIYYKERDELIAKIQELLK